MEREFVRTTRRPSPGTPKAAEKGSAWVDVNLGFLYERGRGVKQDYAEAARLYRAAAEKDLAPEINLWVDYERGRGVDQDNVEAAKWS